MKINKTVLVNSTKKTYIIIGADYPDKTHIYMLKLEQKYCWDLKWDFIYISHSPSVFGFHNISDDTL
jgi:hypothetical protein